MSAFLVENETIDRVLNFLYFNANSSNSDCVPWNERENFQSEEFLTETGKAMLKLNNDAVNYRYNEIDEVPVPYTFRPKRTVNIFQALKSLQCWMYQCSEGEFDKTELFKKFGTIANKMMYKIVSGMDEYNNSQWG